MVGSIEEEIERLKIELNDAIDKRNTLRVKMSAFDKKIDVKNDRITVLNFISAREKKVNQYLLKISSTIQNVRSDISKKLDTSSITNELSSILQTYKESYKSQEDKIPDDFGNAINSIKSFNTNKEKIVNEQIVKNTTKIKNLEIQLKEQTKMTEEKLQKETDELEELLRRKDELQKRIDEISDEISRLKDKIRALNDEL